MKQKNVVAMAALFSLLFAGFSKNALAEGGAGSSIEASVMGGFHVLNQNDTAVPDHFVNVPIVASVGYRLTSILAVEGEFGWMIPVKQSVDVGSGQTQDLKNPDVLTYQSNLRAEWSLSPSWAPYLVAGAGALTALSNTDADRVPKLDRSETMFALNFGAGATYDFSPQWALRGDFRELAAFPSSDAHGLSDASGADTIWMERGTLGLLYRF